MARRKASIAFDDSIEELYENQMRRAVNWGGGDQVEVRSDDRDSDQEAPMEAIDMDESFVFDPTGVSLPPQEDLVNSSAAPEGGSTGDNGFHGQDDGASDAGAGEGELGDYEQLDLDKGAASRYYVSEQIDERRRKEICIVCGEEGHDKKHCTHEHCLACGALDEHTTRNCPLSTSCFRCGGQGHRSRDCPRPRSGYGWGRECERCGSLSHTRATCPTLWRIYTYNSPEELRRARIKMAARMDRELRREGGGFEDDSGSVSSQISDSSHDNGDLNGRRTRREPPRMDWDPAERWCYNCSSNGNHWGDDCPERRVNPSRTNNEWSAFSEFISSSGPYARSIPPPPPTQSRNAGPSSRHYDFPVGNSATVHLADDGPSQSGLDAFDPERMPKSKRQQRREKETQARERSRKQGKDLAEPALLRGARTRSPLGDDEHDDDWFARFQHRLGEGRKSARDLSERDDASGSFKGRRIKGSFNYAAKLAREERGEESRRRGVEKRGDELDSDLDLDLDLDEPKRRGSRKRGQGRAGGSPPHSVYGKGKGPKSGGARSDKGDRSAQSEHDRLRNRQKQEKKKKKLQVQGSRMGEPSFGPFSLDDERAGEGKRKRRGPLYSGGYR
ncbi:hypothetical protein IE53DRAFT_378133 [Violaceomyces palustris]|uniref:Uncharacterized protein n=1 Tax=Violaceomyces palustris TaxID=1673888 RepID=A0ACD0P336_9BASI|nr:hypothetical protein IE53DRAFT_378133 [Violaceomyces palustris]